jgi:hypothetical protein
MLSIRLFAEHAHIVDVHQSMSQENVSKNKIIINIDGISHFREKRKGYVQN